MSLEEFLEQLKQLLTQKQLPIEHQLWDEHDIANYFKYSLDYTKRHIISHPDFPPSRKLPTSIHGHRYAHRWKASDVITYAMAFNKSEINY